MKTKKEVVEFALKWLGKNEPEWGLDEPMDKEEFIEEILKKAVVSDPDTKL